MNPKMDIMNEFIDNTTFDELIALETQFYSLLFSTSNIKEFGIADLFMNYFLNSLSKEELKSLENKIRYRLDSFIEIKYYNNINTTL